MSLYWNMSRPDTVARGRASRAEAKASSTQRQIEVLQDDLDRLSLLCQAMWEIVRERTGVTERDIEQKVNEIDLRDGNLDEKIGRRQRDCPECGRTLHQRHERCLYCGRDVGQEHTFQV